MLPIPSCQMSFCFTNIGLVLFTWAFKKINDIENFHILSHGNNDFDNKVKEALFIKKQKPLLNKHLHQHGASLLLNVF